LFSDRSLAHRSLDCVLLYRPPPSGPRPLSLHAALPISAMRSKEMFWSWPCSSLVEGVRIGSGSFSAWRRPAGEAARADLHALHRSEEHTSELQSRGHLVCRQLLEKKKMKVSATASTYRN